MVSLKNLRRADLRITDRGPRLYVWSSLAHYGLRALFLKPVRRDVEFVMNEYNNEREDYWKPEVNLDEFIFGDSQTPKWILVDDRLYLGKWHEVRLRLLPMLRDHVAKYSKPGDLVVEFGAGSGRNLAYLARELPDRRYLGFELTPRTVEDSRKMMKQFGLPVEMRVQDVTEPINIDGKAAVAFSILALEQLPGTRSHQALEQMSKLTTNAIVCFEPLREMYPYSVRGITSRLRHYRADYLTGLPEHARSLGLRPVAERRTGLALNPLNEICELVLEK